MQKEQSGRYNEKLEQVPIRLYYTTRMAILFIRIGIVDLTSISAELIARPCITSCQPYIVISQLRDVCSYNTCESFYKSDGDVNSYGNLLDLLESIFCFSLLCFFLSLLLNVLENFVYMLAYTKTKKANK